ncbi:VOC family protein [Roseovarius sp. A21]|uniref:VOC family protein n=1 Tax=Roseovarius bejariae TaxID=2576383 RepID=A0A844CTG7_9RHOB|nr:VOC family protein [Roseovarius bejariae]MRU15299.1 VOC family protein [Roseovarius bejariae]
MPHLDSLDHLVLTVSDIPRAITFYETVLGMSAEQFTPADGTTRWALKFGSHKINLHQAGAEFEPKAQNPTPGSADLCFLTEIPLTEWQAHLSRQGENVIEGPVPRTGATGPITSIYLRDPDGNLLEISNKSTG